MTAKKPAKSHVPLTPKEQQVRVENSLVSCLQGQGGQIQLNNLAFGAWPDMTVIVDGVTIGYIHKTEAAVPYLRVRHLAVEKHLVRKGYGQAIVKGLIKVARTLRIETIFFEVENRPPGFEGFFTKHVKATRLSSPANAKVTNVEPGFMLTIPPREKATFPAAKKRRQAINKTASGAQIADVLAAFDNIVFTSLALTDSREQALQDALVVLTRQRAMLLHVSGAEVDDELRRVNLAITLLTNLGAR